jgi:small-conductance mechanosensitive channel
VAYAGAYSDFEFQVYAEDRTQATPEGRRLTQLIWAEMRERGITVPADPVHFSMPDVQDR